MIKALIFDVFGTCVDWRSSVAREVAAALPGVDAEAFATAWRAEYDPAMARIREGGRGYVPLDDLHLENLHKVAADFGVRAPDSLNSAWERLAPWPDVVAGLTTLKARHIIAPCSNGSIALMTRLARYGRLPWDCILGAEIARDYKPKPAVYLASCAALRLPPEAVMMVAAHNDDLFAARDAGLSTAFVCRPAEHGPQQETDLVPASDWTVVATDFIHLARLLADRPAAGDVFA
jgi:2-haloacid dehalogenase